MSERSQVDCDSEEGIKLKSQCRSKCMMYKADNSACNYCEDWRCIKLIKLNIYEKAISKWGKEAQILMTIEETTELNFLLIKYLRNGKSNYRNLIDEIADVEIMLTQLRIVFRLDEIEINQVKDFKLKRLEERLNES